jgi:hypothetical protein
MNEVAEQSDAQRIIVDSIQDSRLRRLYEYWLGKAAGRRFPSRRDVDPVDFAYVLGHVVLFDVMRDPLRFRVRVHGSEMAARAGYDLTGKFLDDLPSAEYRRYVRQRCETLARHGAPTLVRHERPLEGKTRRYEAIWLPFSDDGENVNMLLAALIYDR